MDLTTHRMELLIRMRETKKPEEYDRLMQGVVRDGQAYHFAKFIVMNYKGDVPEVILDRVAQNNRWATELAIRLKNRRKPVPEKLVDTIAATPNLAVEYVAATHDNNPDTEPQILSAIYDSESAVRVYADKIIGGKLNLPLPQRVVDKLAANESMRCLKLIKTYIRHGKKKYADIPHTMITSVLDHESLAIELANFLQPHVDEIPDEVMAAIGDQDRVRMKWHKGGLAENFAVWFNSRD